MSGRLIFLMAQIESEPGKAFNIAVKHKADKNRNLQGILCHDGRSVYCCFRCKGDGNDENDI